MKGVTSLGGIVLKTYLVISGLLFFLNPSFATAQNQSQGTSCSHAAAEAELKKCNDTAAAAQIQCDKAKGISCFADGAKAQAPANTIQKDTAVLGQTAKNCKPEVEKANRECNAAVKSSLAFCEKTKVAADADRQAGECKVTEGQNMEKQADKVKQDANNLSAKAASPHLHPVEVQEVQSQAGEKHVHASQLLNQAVERKDQGSQQAEMATNVKSTADDIIQLLNGLREQSNTSSEAVQKSLTSASDRASAAVKETNGETADSSYRAPAKNEKSDQTGSAGDTPGQGSPGGQTPAQAQQKQDEAGGGMPSLPSFGGSGSGNSTPLKTAEPKQDCSNPSVAASNPVCTCRINPGDSRCASILAADKNSQAAKKAAKMYNGEEGGGGGFTTGGGGYKDPKEKNISQHGQMSQGPGGSVGKGVGSGQGSQVASNGKSGPPGRSNNSRASSLGKGGGTYGGGGGAGGALIANQPNNKIPSTFAQANTNKNRVAGKSAQELKMQMQNRFNFQRRGPSGVVGPDGITGPHTDQFKKIRVRYAELLGQ